MIWNVRGCLDAEDGSSVREAMCLCGSYDTTGSIAFHGFMSSSSLMHVMVTSCRAAESGNFGGRAKASCRVGFRGPGRGRDAGVWNPPGRDVPCCFSAGGISARDAGLRSTAVTGQTGHESSCLDPEGVCSGLSRGEDGAGGGCTGGFPCIYLVDEAYAFPFHILPNIASRYIPQRGAFVRTQSRPG